MRISIIPAQGDGYVVVKLPDGKESAFDETIAPLILSKTGSNTFQDFSFAWMAVAAIASAIIGAVKSKGGSITGATSGFSQMSQYLVDNKYLYCADDCGKAWRLNINKYGGIDIQSRPLEGANPRFKCSILPPDLLRLVPCKKTQEIGASGGKGQLPDVPITDKWWFWALLGGMGLTLVLFARKKSSSRKQVRA